MPKPIEQRSLDFLTGRYRESEPSEISPPTPMRAEVMEAVRRAARDNMELGAKLLACAEHERGAMGDCLRCGAPMVEPGDRRCAACFAWRLDCSPRDDGLPLCPDCRTGAGHG